MKPISDKPHDGGSHNQVMTPAIQRVIDAAEKRKRDKSAMPAGGASASATEGESKFMRHLLHGS